MSGCVNVLGRRRKGIGGPIFVQHRDRGPGPGAVHRRELFEGALSWLDTGRSDVLAFRRGGGVCVTVFGQTPFAPPAEWGPVVLSSRLERGGCVTHWLSRPSRPS